MIIQLERDKICQCSVVLLAQMRHWRIIVVNKKQIFTLER